MGWGTPFWRCWEQRGRLGLWYLGLQRASFPTPPVQRGPLGGLQCEVERDVQQLEWAREQLGFCFTVHAWCQGGSVGRGVWADKSALPDSWEEARRLGLGALTGRRGGQVGCASWETKDAQRCPLWQIPGWPLGLESPASSFLSPAVDSHCGLEGQLGREQSLQQAGGEHEGAGAPQPEMASVSPRKALLMRWNTAFFGVSWTATGKPSSGGTGSLRGSPRLRGTRGTLCFRPETGRGR